MWILIVDTGKHRGRQVKLPGERVVVGRGEEVQIRIGSADVSREHCTFVLSEAGVQLEDHGSRNGTLVNGTRVEGQCALSVGDTVTVGPMTFRLAQAGVPAAIRPRGGAAPAAASPATSGGVKLSDDDIANWLTDYEIPVTGDTTVITGSAADSTHEGPALPATPPPPTGPQVPPPSKARFDSVAEEAADIIRRHRAYLALLQQAERDAT